MQSISKVEAVAGVKLACSELKTLEQRDDLLR
jgi:hypothetical protein